MSFNHSKEKNHRRALKAFAESEALSDSDDEEGLDIIESSRKDLDLSQYIESQLMPPSMHSLSTY
jgi:hypothetical protein